MWMGSMESYGCLRVEAWPAVNGSEPEAGGHEVSSVHADRHYYEVEVDNERDMARFEMGCLQRVATRFAIHRRGV
jgi:hypothetical protein